MGGCNKYTGFIQTSSDYYLDKLFMQLNLFIVILLS